MKRDLKLRTKKFSLEIISMIDLIPKSSASFVLQKQVARSGTSIGANYRSALRGRSKKEFAAKIGIVEEAAHETVYWLELIQESKMLGGEIVGPLLSESKELTAIFTTMHKTARLNINK